MWGWGRGSKDDDGNSNNTNSTIHTTTSTASKVGANFGLGSPRSPTSLSSEIATPKKMASFSGGKQYSNASGHQRNSIGGGGGKSEFSKQRRRSWGGKRNNKHNTGSGNSNPGGEILTAVTIMEKGPNSLSESFSGIEVSLSHDKSVQNYPFNATKARNGYPASSNTSESTWRVSSDISKHPFGNGNNTGASKVGLNLISFQAQLTELQKVYRAQYQSLYPLPEKSSGTNESGPSPLKTTHSQHFTALPNQSDVTKSFKHREDHRLPLFNHSPHQMNYDDAMSILKGYEYKDEAQCLKDEIELTEQEIAALERDRMEIEQLWTAHNAGQPGPTTIEHRDDIAARIGNSESPFHSNKRVIEEHLETEFDINRQLMKPANLHTGNPLTESQIVQLQRQRGLCLTVSIENAKALESLLSKLGGKATALPTSSVTKLHPTRRNCLVTTLRPSNEGRTPLDGITIGSGAACTIQQVALLSSSTTDESSFFISTDTGNAHNYGRLPDRMFRRLKAATTARHTSHATSSTGLHSVLGIGDTNDPHYVVRDILYLVTGPGGCYYAEFRSGECWWGLTATDDELDAILSEWEVYRIVFGPMITLNIPTSNGYGSAATAGKGGITSRTGTTSSSTSSWIVIARDGRVAWKNLPSRLHNKLARRLANEATPIEVALGSGGSYFVRFADGSSDWQLPSRPAEACQRLEMEGSIITSLSLNSELSNDFIIRHR